MRELNVEYWQQRFQKNSYHNEGKSIKILPFISNSRTKTMRKHFNDTTGLFVRNITQLIRSTDFPTNNIGYNEQIEINFLEEIIKTENITGNIEQLEYFIKNYLFHENN